MKKKLVASLAAAMVLGVAGTSFAASNPFVDVPAKHWAYASVTKLAQAGIVDGYGDGTYLGDKMISRYEMAQIVAKAMARSDKADAAQKAIIDQLSVEFASELEGLNVRVTKLEKNASSVKITGYARIKFEDTTDKQKDDGTAEQADKTLKLRTRIFINGNINDQWAYAGRLQNEQNFYTAANDSNTDFNMAYITGPVAGTTATIGRFDINPLYGNLMDDGMDGVKFSFGNKVKTNVYYGKVSDASASTCTTFAPAAVDKDITMTGIDFKYGASKITNLVGGYYSYDAKDSDLKRNIYEIGADTKIAKNLVLNAEYLKSDENDDNKAYVYGLTYKASNIKNVGSFSTWANYRNFERNVAVDNLSSLDNALLNQSKDGKGYEIGFNYIPAVNTKLMVRYVDTKGVSNDKDQAKFIRAQAEFWF